MRKLLIIFWILLTTLLLAGCQSEGGAEPLETAVTGAVEIDITSPAFESGDTIPKKYTCDGADISPELAWSGLPDGTQTLALIADDPDAPGKTFVHWVLFNLDPDLDGLPEAAAGFGLDGGNGFGRTGYGGPCPPNGKPHRYVFKLFALDTALALKPGASRADLDRAMSGHILGQGTLVGIYER